jgi:hypothetical protein
MMNIKESFDKYFHEPEGYSLRSERFYDDLLNAKTNPMLGTRQHFHNMHKWIEAAYIKGCRDMAQETLGQIRKYDAESNIDLKTLDGCLMVWYTKILQEAEDE